jgi:hypothetical protein
MAKGNMMEPEDAHLLAKAIMAKHMGGGEVAPMEPMAESTEEPSDGFYNLENFSQDEDMPDTNKKPLVASIMERMRMKRFSK